MKQKEFENRLKNKMTFKNFLTLLHIAKGCADEGSVLCMMCKKCEACGPVVDPTPNDGDLEYRNAIDAWNKRSK